MISAGYKSAYQQGYSDAMRDFRKKSKTDVLNEIKAEISNIREFETEVAYGLLDTTVELREVYKIIDKYRESEGEK